MLPLHKLHRFRPDLGSALAGGKMAAAGNNEQPRMRDKRVHLFSQTERGDFVFRAPDNQDRHFEAGEKAIGGVFAGEHGGEGALNDPAILLGEAEDVAGDEVRDDGRVGHEERVELVEIGGGLRREETGIPGRLLVDSGRVVEHEMPDALGMVAGDALDDPAAHGPAAQVDLLEAEGVEEADDGGGLIGDGVREAGGFLTAAVAGQVGHVDAVAGMDEPGGEAAPIFGAATKAVDENHNGASGGADDVVMHAKAGDGDGVGLKAGEALAHVGQMREPGDRTGPESESGGEHERGQHACGGKLFFLPNHGIFRLSVSSDCARCQPASMTRTVMGSSASALWLFHSARSTQRTASASEAASNCPPATRQR